MVLLAQQADSMDWWQSRKLAELQLKQQRQLFPLKAFIRKRIRKNSNV